MSAVIADEARGRVDRERRAANDEHVRLRNGAHRAVDARAVEPLLIQHDVRLDKPAARTVRDAATVADELGRVELAALLAVVAVDRAVQLIDVFAARLLVQAVDVLRDDGAQLTRAFQLRQLLVRGVGPGLERQHLFAVEAVEIIGVPVEKRMAEDRLGRVVEPLMIQAVHAAEILNAALCADACAAEEHDVVTFCNPGF